MSRNRHHGGKSGHDDHHHDHGSDGRGVRLKGTNGDDVLTGTERNDELSGGKGDDLLTGLGGNDKLDGGKGDDRLLGGDGNDRLFGGDGNDFLDGGRGNDFLHGGKGNDFLDGGAGNDIVMAGKGNDVANYTLAGNPGAHDVYDGGKGFDTLQLTLTSAERERADVQADIAAFEAFLARKAHPHSDDGRTFQFQSFDLDVRNFEALDINMAPVAGDDVIGGTGGGAGPIRVAVVGGSSFSSYEAVAAQLRDTTVFDFVVTEILDDPSAPKSAGYWTDNFDVVVLGDAGFGTDYGSTPLFSALVDFVNAGGGVITTGGFVDVLTNLSGDFLFDADYISPVANNGSQAAVGPSMITILGNHEITAGLTDNNYDVVADAPSHELAQAIDLDVDVDGDGVVDVGSGATILANGIGTDSKTWAAIVYNEVGEGLTAYLGSRHMANPAIGDMESLRTIGSDADKIFEQAVAWAAGDRSGSSAATDEDTPLVIDDALLLANDTDADAGDVLAIYLDSLQMTSAKGAAISLDANGDIVYDPTSSQELQDLSAGEIVTDSFDYTVSDGHGGTDIATVSLSVAGLAVII